MSNEPSIIERQALGNLIRVLESKHEELKNYYLESFEDWDPIFDSGITGYKYYKTLNDFPMFAKRNIILAALHGWRYHKDLHALYDTITTLISLNLCGPAEYYFLQIIYKTISKFGSLLNDLPYVEIECNSQSRYTLRFWKTKLGPYEGGTYGIIDFQLHDIGKDPVVAIVPWNSLLRNAFHYPSEDEDDELNEDEIEQVTAPMYEIFKDEWVKTHCPWINSDWDFYYEKEQMGRGVVYILHSLTYNNSNGI